MRYRAHNDDDNDDRGGDSLLDGLLGFLLFLPHRENVNDISEKERTCSILRGSLEIELYTEVIFVHTNTHVDTAIAKDRREIRR